MCFRTVSKRYGGQPTPVTQLQGSRYRPFNLILKFFKKQKVSLRKATFCPLEKDALGVLLWNFRAEEEDAAKAGKRGTPVGGKSRKVGAAAKSGLPSEVESLRSPRTCVGNDGNSIRVHADAGKKREKSRRRRTWLRKVS